MTLQGGYLVEWWSGGVLHQGVSPSGPEFRHLSSKYIFYLYYIRVSSEWQKERNRERAAPLGGVLHHSTKSPPQIPQNREKRIQNENSN